MDEILLNVYLGLFFGRVLILNLADPRVLKESRNGRTRVLVSRQALADEVLCVVRDVPPLLGRELDFLLQDVLVDLFDVLAVEWRLS